MGVEVRWVDPDASRIAYGRMQGFCVWAQEVNPYVIHSAGENFYLFGSQMPESAPGLGKRNHAGFYSARAERDASARCK